MTSLNSNWFGQYVLLNHLKIILIEFYYYWKSKNKLNLSLPSAYLEWFVGNNLSWLSRIIVSIGINFRSIALGLFFLFEKAWYVHKIVYNVAFYCYFLIFLLVMTLCHYIVFIFSIKISEIAICQKKLVDSGFRFLE